MNRKLACKHEGGIPHRVKLLVIPGISHHHQIGLLLLLLLFLVLLLLLLLLLFLVLLLLLLLLVLVLIIIISFYNLLSLHFSLQFLTFIFKAFTCSSQSSYWS